MPADLQIAGSGKPPATGAERYEPLVTGQLARESVEVVDRIHRLFVKAAEQELSELLQVPVKMTQQETEQATFADSLKNRSEGDQIIALDLFPVSGCGFLSFSPELLFGALDILMATPGDPQGNPRDHSGRTVTSIELHVLRELFDLIAQTLAETWKQFYPAAFRQIPAFGEELEQLVAAAAPDRAVIMNASVELNGEAAGFRLILPTSLARLAELKIKEESASRNEPEAIDSAVFERLGDARIDIQVVLQGTRIRIRDLLDLAPGRILVVDSSTDPSFDCLANGTLQFSGSPVWQDGKCGIQIGVPSPSLPGS
jgi:flagellar motor switch protein FliM